jgi:DNA-binding CsgD family transcriptional regulator/MFS family permease
MRRARLDGRHAAYLAPASLFALWQAGSGWLVTYWSIARLGAESATWAFALFFLAHGAGIAASALWLDRRPRARGRRAAMLAAASIAGSATASLAFASGGWLIAACVLSGAAGGFPIAFLSLYALRGLPPDRRGTTLGLASAAGLAAHFIAFVAAFPGVDAASLIGKTFLASFAILLSAAAALALPACRDRLWDGAAPETGTPEGPRRAPPPLLPLLASVVACFFVSYGMQDFSATGYWMSSNASLGYTRLSLIAGLVAAGALWDRRSREVLMIASFGLLAMGFVCMAFEYRGAASFIGFSSVQVAGALFPLGVRLLFIERAGSSRRPAFLCSLGLSLPIVLKQVGILSAALLYAGSGGASIFVASLVLIVAGAPLVAKLFEGMREAGVRGAGDPRGAAREPPAARELAGLAEELSARFGFTRRERQVAELSLRGLTALEMTRILNVSEPTVKHYVRRILEKTGTKSQKQLLSTLIGSR